MTVIALKALTHTALRFHFSAPRARRLWELHEMGVSLDTLSRGWKVLVGLGVTPENDREWSFYTDVKESPLPLCLWHVQTGTWIEVVVLDALAVDGGADSLPP